jgi:hypothetical protein
MNIIAQQAHFVCVQTDENCHCTFDQQVQSANAILVTGQ